MKYIIRRTHKLDNQRLYNLLFSEVENKNLMKEIKEHIRNDISFKLQDEDGMVLGLFLAKKFDKHYSLSYFFIVEEIRKKPIVIKFFISCLKKLNLLIPIYIKANKNFDLYNRYFKETKEKDIYLFKGLRDSIDNRYGRIFNKWVE